MDQQEFLHLLQKTLFLILQLAGPVLLVSLVVGILVSIFQSVTQLQEATLTFVPKILAGILTIIFLAPWMIDVYITGITEIFTNLNSYIR